MQEKINLSSLVSIIIPYYNAERFIEETIRSAIDQTYSDIEIICVNDGSTDNSQQVVEKIADKRIINISKCSTGVSDSRNKGLDMANGKYVLFLDADDILEIDFLKSRILFLQNSSYYDACCTSVCLIDENSKQQPNIFLGTHDNITKQILFYQNPFFTCPSNFLFKRDVLVNNHLKFDKDLSSSADRYFLIQFSVNAKIGLIYTENNNRLLYRVHNFSMSRVVSDKLLKDNLLFMKKVLVLPFIPDGYKKMFKFKINYILSGGYFKLNNYLLSFKYAIISVFHNPILFIKQLCAV
jgi:teichuronic acid biosynthesis glycosyltransferase TuaG